MSNEPVISLSDGTFTMSVSRKSKAGHGEYRNAFTYRVTKQVAVSETYTTDVLLAHGSYYSVGDEVHALRVTTAKARDALRDAKRLYA